MTRKLGLVLATAAGTALVAGPALALTATTQGDLSIHASTATDAAVVEKVASGASVMVDGCLADGTMCKVTHDGKTGWVAASQLQVSANGQIVPLSTNPQDVTVKQIKIPADNANKDGQAAGAMAGAAAGGAAGFAVGGPVGGVVGALIGSAGVGAMAKPEPATVTWVEQHPVAPTYLKGDVKAGAKIPESVALNTVPDSKYSYLNVNDQTVFVNPDSRAIVYIVPAS